MFLGALATAAVAIFAVPANAVVYSSGFDPVGDVDFIGTALFKFNDGCLTPDGFKDAATCSLTMLSAELDMTDTDSGDTAHLDFGLQSVVGELFIAGGELAGINSNKLGPAFVFDDSSTLFGPWWIQWQTDGGVIGLTSFDLLSNGVSNQVLLFTGTCNVDGEVEFCNPNDEPSGVALTVTFTRQTNGVPEPGTLGLILGGVGAAWWARRRKAAA
jgi:hypothetical protein